ncbi:MAG: hypothetical protein EZS28_008722 [Streblomastix strix]|uniref:Uncharacterized protein n=1 Tax=Streblomastix strix TaxID=222440 RepID=A0A5J4WMA6_9EUKA|nr:MAG: hypothetical protein EZS28_008722 [Streblomastix strix]
MDRAAEILEKTFKNTSSLSLQIQSPSPLIVMNILEVLEKILLADERIPKSTKLRNVLEKMKKEGETNAIKQKSRMLVSGFDDQIEERLNIVEQQKQEADKENVNKNKKIKRNQKKHQKRKEIPETGFYGSYGIYYNFAGDWAYDEQGNPCSQKDMDDYEASIEELEDYEADPENQYKHFVWKPKPPQKPISAPTDGTATTENKSAPSTESGAESATTADQTVIPKKKISVLQKMKLQAAERQNQPVQNQTTGGNQSQINSSLFAAGDAQK